MSGAWADMIIIPPKWVEGLKSLPEQELSFLEMNNDVSSGQQFSTRSLR